MKDSDQKSGFRSNDNKFDNRNSEKDRFSHGDRASSWNVFVNFQPILPQQRIAFIRAFPNDTIFVEKIRAIEPDCFFSRDGVYTIFVPKDRVLENKRILAEKDGKDLCVALKKYVVDEPINIKDIDARNKLSVNALDGSTLTITKDGDNHFVNGVKILDTKVLAEGGVVLYLFDQGL
jgi:hypothetical protein